MAKTAPAIEIFIRPGTSSNLWQLIATEELDAAILVRPPFALTKAFGWQALRRDPFVLLCPEAWAGHGGARLFWEKPLIRYDCNNWGGRLADRWLRRSGVAPKDWSELDQLAAIAVFVDQGLGVSIVPDWSPPWREGLRMARLPRPGRTPSRKGRWALRGEMCLRQKMGSDQP